MKPPTENRAGVHVSSRPRNDVRNIRYSLNIQLNQIGSCWDAVTLTDSKVQPLFTKRSEL